MPETQRGEDHSVTERQWWQEAVIYQIYPRSFCDSTGDGVGDLQGILSRVDYLDWLGVDAVWLSPIFPSPMADFGYDVSDYTDVDPIFGSLDDLFALRDELHRREMKLILDLVPNHTSEEHPWFVDSRSSRQSEKRDWYLWKDPASGGGPPTNWLSVFGGSAWEWDEQTGQYYYHAFLKEQPDLNWRNPEVREAMFDVIRFWLDRGIDGFRIDVIWHLVKDDSWRDNPRDETFRPGEAAGFRSQRQIYNTDRPEVHEVIREMRDVFDEYADRVMIGEIYLPVERLVRYYGEKGEGVHVPYNFHLILSPWDAREIRDLVLAYEALIPEDGWPSWVLGNHDKSRVATRVGSAQARVAAMMLLTLRGTPTIYYGDEIGMHDVPVSPDAVHDPAEKNEPGVGAGRDPQRTPMQWSDAVNGGFTDGDPWLPLPDDLDRLNVKAEENDERSMLSLYRALISIRRERPALRRGSHAPLPATGDVLAWIRKSGSQRIMIVLNLSGTKQSYDLGGRDLSGSILLSTHLDREGKIEPPIELRPDEGLVVDLQW
ncbi:MAG: alpha-amylase family glycosyl hydrolase [Thermoanaerobaculia bacterium]|nr:alpha-amylase family glycosyl hydrolase [Thermoanaerobaculia bacterium]